MRGFTTHVSPDITYNAGISSPVIDVYISVEDGMVRDVLVEDVYLNKSAMVELVEGVNVESTFHMLEAVKWMYDKLLRQVSVGQHYKKNTSGHNIISRSTEYRTAMARTYHTREFRDDKREQKGAPKTKSYFDNPSYIEVSKDYIDPLKPEKPISATRESKSDDKAAGVCAVRET